MCVIGTRNGEEFCYAFVSAVAAPAALFNA